MIMHQRADIGWTPALAAALLVILILPPTPASAQTVNDDQPPLSLTFIGNEAMAISDGRTTLVSDFPYLSGYSIYMDYDPVWLTMEGEVISLITHRHPDHFQARLFMSMGWKVIGPPEVTLGVPPHRVVPFAGQMRYGDIAVTAIETPHADIEHYSYLVEWNGVSLYFPGDTETLDAFMALGRQVDVLFATPWALRALLKDRVDIPARRIVIYHHTASEEVPQCAKCVVMVQGQMMQLGTGAMAN